MTAEAFAVSRTLQAMEVVAFRASTAPEVAGALRINARTARRLLNRLVADGWLTRNEGRGQPYSPTLRIVALAAHVARRSPLVQHAAPAVHALAADLGTASHLAIPSYRSVLCLLRSCGDRGTPPALGELVPGHATAAGKVLLAHRAAWRQSLLAQPLEPLTGRTLVDPARVEREAELTLARGWALEDSEHRPGHRAVAAPVHAPTGEAVAALAACMEAAEDVERVAARVVARAREASAALAATGRERGWLSD
jgi:IclR family pca regulon transcriptional regulator